MKARIEALEREKSDLQTQLPESHTALLELAEHSNEMGRQASARFDRMEEIIIDLRHNLGETSVSTKSHEPSGDWRLHNSFREHDLRFLTSKYFWCAYAATHISGVPERQHIFSGVPVRQLIFLECLGGNSFLGSVNETDSQRHPPFSLKVNFKRTPLDIIMPCW